MVADAPALSEVLPSFHEFARGTVLVAHNARFDAGFLRRAFRDSDKYWPFTATLDTVALARSVLLRDEVPNVKLATLAHHFKVPDSPNHRALTDARATVAVLHALLERIGNLGVHTLEDVMEFTRGVSPSGAPSGCGRPICPRGRVSTSSTQISPNSSGEVTRQVLYVGRSVNVRQRSVLLHGRRDPQPHGRDGANRHGVEAIECATPCRPRC